MGPLDWTLVILVVLAYVQVFALRSKTQALRADLDRTTNALDANLKETKQALEVQIGTVQTLLAMMQSGRTVTPDMIKEGRAYHNLPAREAQDLLQKHPDTFVLDVRTPGEYASAHIPGAKLLPIDEIESRFHELPANAERIVVHCEAGGRSAAACDFLAGKGFTNLYNMVGGMHAWKGPREGKGGGH
jgi:rhodanese-related sulfurtransferase